MTKQALTKFAEQDLKIARKDGRMTVVQTKKGNLEIKYTNGTYMISDFNQAYSVGGFTGYAHYVGRKAGAIEFLINNYEVIND